MQYKIYRYTLERQDGRPVPTHQHFEMFNKSKGSDFTGRYARYRGHDNALLMYIQKYGVDFAGLVGRHSTEREVTSYDADDDKTEQVPVADDDYPNVAFICFPRMQMFACVDGSAIKAGSAISRLHAILAQRQHLAFVGEPLTENIDLRRAIHRFKIIEVTFEVLPVNPHTGDLGYQLDENRKRDHIKKIVGKLHATPSDPLKLNGGFLEQIQQLQQSGHSRVGYTGVDEHGTLIQVPKPQETKRLTENEDADLPGTEQQIRIDLQSTRERFPFSKQHVNYIKEICTAFSDIHEE